MTDSALSREAFEATTALAERFMMTSADGQMKYAVGGFYALLLTEAAACATRAQQAALAGDPKAEVGASASAVLAAAAACETYLSEFLARAEMFRVLDASTTAGMRGERDAQQQWKELIKARGVKFDFKTSAEYARVGCLFHLRNQIAHRNSRLDIQDSWPERLRECVRQGVIPVEKGTFYDWAVMAYRHPVASWAHETADRWLGIAGAAIHFTC